MAERTPFDFNGRRYYVDTYGGIATDEFAYGIDYGEAVELANPGIDWNHGRGGSYQGEWMSVGRDDEGRYWLVEGSFGSCSGCDWLQRIDSVPDAEAFLRAMTQRALIGDNLDKAIAYLNATRENSSYNDKNEAIDELIAALRKEAA